MWNYIRAAQDGTFLVLGHKEDQLKSFGEGLNVVRDQWSAYRRNVARAGIDTLRPGNSASAGWLVISLLSLSPDAPMRFGALRRAS